MIKCNNRGDGFRMQSIAEYAKIERGSATLMSIGIIMCILVILGIVAGVLNMKSDARRLQSVANIVALSGANEAFFGVDGCKVAQATAMLNNAKVTECNSTTEPPDISNYAPQRADESRANDGAQAEGTDADGETDGDAVSDANCTELVPKVRLEVKLISSMIPLISASATAKTTDLPCGVGG